MEINFPAKEAYVIADTQTLNTNALIAALKNAGYEATVKAGASP